jgi:hypothetical protein
MQPFVRADQYFSYRTSHDTVRDNLPTAVRRCRESTEKERRRRLPTLSTRNVRNIAVGRTSVPPQIGKSLLDVSKIPDLENKHMWTDR